MQRSIFWTPLRQKGWPLDASFLLRRCAAAVRPLWWLDGPSGQTRNNAISCGPVHLLTDHMSAAPIPHATRRCLLRLASHPISAASPAEQGSEQQQPFRGTLFRWVTIAAAAAGPPPPAHVPMAPAATPAPHLCPLWQWGPPTPKPRLPPFLASFSIFLQPIL